MDGWCRYLQCTKPKGIQEDLVHMVENSFFPWVRILHASLLVPHLLHQGRLKGTGNEAEGVKLSCCSIKEEEKYGEITGVLKHQYNTNRLYGWKTQRNAPSGTALKQQSRDVMSDFKRRIITQFMEQGVNIELYNKKKDREEYHSIVPTSGVRSPTDQTSHQFIILYLVHYLLFSFSHKYKISLQLVNMMVIPATNNAEGVPELVLLLVQCAQKRMTKRLTYSEKVQACVLFTLESVLFWRLKLLKDMVVDVILVNGMLHEGDQIVVCGLQGPIVTNIRALLTPHPMRELWVKLKLLRPLLPKEFVMLLWVNSLFLLSRL
ncbi:hypothetical protein ACS0TY_000041 [Phlomoides rotata]